MHPGLFLILQFTAICKQSFHLRVYIPRREETQNYRILSTNQRAGWTIQADACMTTSTLRSQNTNATPTSIYRRSHIRTFAKHFDQQTTHSFCRHFLDIPMVWQLLRFLLLHVPMLNEQAVQKYCDRACVRSTCAFGKKLRFLESWEQWRAISRLLARPKMVQETFQLQSRIYAHTATRTTSICGQATPKNSRSRATEARPYNKLMSRTQILWCVIDVVSHIITILVIGISNNIVGQRVGENEKSHVRRANK